MKLSRFWMGVIFMAGILVAGVALGPIVAEQVSYSVEKGKISALRERLAELSKTDTLSPLFETVNRAVQPSVVVLQVKQKVRVPAGPRMVLPPGLEDEFRKRFGDSFPLLPQDQDDSGEDKFFYQHGQGSGVIVDAENGYVLTNNHVVDRADQVEVILADGRKFETDWVRTDPATDLAVLKIPAGDLIACPLGDSDQIEVGHWVLASTG
jgi:S1-C subfamily serine protease